MKLTREQNLALMDDRNVVVTANAGSGKTSVLVNRYLGILTEGKALISEIVAITFTRKAAHEMLARVTKEIDKTIASTKSNFGVDNENISDNDIFAVKTRLSRLKRIRERLYNARIATFHSFCSRIVRDYPVEADVSPNFTELSEADGIRFKLDAVRSAIEDHLADDVKKKVVIVLASIFELKRLESALVDLISDSARLRKLAEIYDKQPEEIANNFKILFDEKLLENAQKLKQYAYRIDRNEHDPKYGERIDNALNITEEILQCAKSFNYPKIQVLIKELNDNCKIKNSKFLTVVKKKLARKENYELESIESLLQTVDDITRNTKYTDDYITKSQELIELALLAQDYYASYKRRSEALDFDDLINIADRLLDIPEVVNDVRGQIKYLLVDEFQDTDELQFSIISKIIGDFSYNASQINLFIVGDGKQSIYGFRGADVRVFLKAQQSIKKGNLLRQNEERLEPDPLIRGDKITDLTEDECSGLISLNVSYRLKPVIAAFCNTIFNNIMDSSISEFDTGYEEFIHARNESNEFHTTKEIEAGDDLGTINILIGRTESGEQTGDDDDENEELTGSGELIARQILKLVSGEDRRKVYNSDNEPCKPEFSDIAVIARQKNKLTPIISAFIRNRIPYKLYSGGGFFEAPEITDLVAFIRFLTDQNDDLSLVAILRSPYFSMDDDELMAIAFAPAKESFWQKFKFYVNETSPNFSKVKSSRALELLEYFIIEARRLPMRRLLEEIREKTGWIGIVEKNPAKEQILANVKKFVGFAIEFEGRGFRTIRDFIKELEILAENSSQQESSVTSSSNSVALLTTHSVKGLEYPIVFIAGANSRLKGMDSVFYDQDRGVLFKYTRRVEDSPFEIEVDLPARNLLKDIEKTRSRAEEKRIFYVAATRARDHLFFACDYKTTQKNINLGSDKHTMNFLMEGLNIDSIELSDIDEYTISVDTRLKTLVNDGISNKAVSFPINIINQIDTVGYSATAELETAKKGERIFIEPNMSYNNEMFSATKMALYEKSAVDYELRYLIGLPEKSEDKVYQMEIDPADSKINASDKGNIIHRLLASVNLWLSPAGKIESESFDLTFNSLLQNMKIPNDDKLKTAIRNTISKIISTSIFRNNINSILNSLKEFELTIPIGNDFLSGTFDLLFQSETTYEIWDWKTNSLTDISQAAIIAEQYRLQMIVYGYLASKRFALKRIKTKLLFTSLAKDNLDDKGWIIEYEFNEDDFLKFENEYFDKFEKMKVY